MVSVLAIGGSDPSGGAGIEADLAVFTQLGVHGRTAITALTVQRHSPLPAGEGQGEGEVHATPPHILEAILHSHTHDRLPDTIKIGMIGTVATLQVITQFLKQHPRIPVVLDTVLRASSGLGLLEPDAIPVLKHELLPLATVVTPNLEEAGILTDTVVNSVADMAHAAKQLHHDGQWIVVKGGHLSADPIDVVYDGKEIYQLSGRRLEVAHSRGTGCTFASAIAAHIALGNSVPQSIQMAKGLVRERLNRYGMATRF